MAITVYDVIPSASMPTTAPSAAKQNLEQKVIEHRVLETKKSLEEIVPTILDTYFHEKGLAKIVSEYLASDEYTFRKDHHILYRHEQADELLQKAKQQLAHAQSIKPQSIFDLKAIKEYKSAKELAMKTLSAAQNLDPYPTQGRNIYTYPASAEAHLIILNEECSKRLPYDWSCIGKYQWLLNAIPEEWEELREEISAISGIAL